MKTDWKKKYEEALERARKYHGGDEGTLVCIEDMLEDVFPELRESEDEKMKRAIVDALLSHNNSINLLSLRGYQIEDVKAWLEKQKEQKPYIEGYGDTVDVFSDGSISCKQKQKPAERNTATINGEPIPTENHSVNIPLAEWSEEDEDFINMLILHFNYLIDKGGDSVETYKSYVEKLKSLRPHWKPSEEQMTALQNAVALTACDKELARLYNQLKKLM